MKVLALTPWPVYPATSGGQERCWNLLSNIPEVTIHALDWSGADSWQRVGATNYRTIAADPVARIRAQQLFKSGITTYDPIPSIVKDDLTNFRKAIDDSDPDLIILEHPWLLDLIDGRPYIYDSHNCETRPPNRLKQAINHTATPIPFIDDRARHGHLSLRTPTDTHGAPSQTVNKYLYDQNANQP